MTDPFSAEEGPQVSVTLKAGPSYNEDMVNIKASPADMAKLFGIPEEGWDGKISTLMKAVKAVGDWNRKQYGGKA